MIQFNTIKQQNNKILPKPTTNYRRINHSFIGLSHLLQQKRRQRRKVSLDEQSMVNKVILLQKEQIKTQKHIESQKQKLIDLIQIKQRQIQQKQQKQKRQKQQQQQIEKLKRQNQYIRMLHKMNVNNVISSMHKQNHRDYAKIKQQLKQGEQYKKLYQSQDIRKKQEKYHNINKQKEKGRINIDKFYKKKNKQHIQEYTYRLNTEERKTLRKVDSIKALQNKEKQLKNKLQLITLRASRMENIVGQLSKSIEQSRVSSSRTPKVIEKDSTTILGSLTERNIQSRKNYKQQVEQSIDNMQQQVIEKQIKSMRKKRKNKHANRYKEYEQF